MFVRIPLVALAAFALTGCDLVGPKSNAAAPAPKAQASRDCCCKVCPTDAAPTVAKTVKTAKATPHREVVRVIHRREAPVRHARSERRAYAYQRSDESLSGGRYGGRYGVSGRAMSGVSVSVEESESFSERSRYSESSSSYGSRSGAVYGSAYASGYGRSEGFYYEDRDGRVRRSGPAGIDRAGYLTWPGKVEN